eukprot:4499085-Pleurochrysis_carterae.AAC.2
MAIVWSRVGRYDSTADILYNLYDRVAIGGYVVVDDFGWTHGRKELSNETAVGVWGAKQAVLDFRALHSIEDAAHVMRDIDGSGAWWRKARKVRVQRWRYTESLQQGRSQQTLSPKPKLTRHDYWMLQKRWDTIAGKTFNSRVLVP